MEGHEELSGKYDIGTMLMCNKCKKTFNAKMMVYKDKNGFVCYKCMGGDSAGKK